MTERETNHTSLDHDHAEGYRCHGCGRHTSRRRLLGGIGAAGVIALAGCLGDDDVETETPTPIALDDNQECDVCGMLIAQHPGPNGQVFFEDYPPERDGPAWYDSIRELYVDRFMLEDRGEEPIITYVTDYSSVNWDIIETDGTRQISGHVAADSFTDARDVTFVIESEVQGVMGVDLIPFSDEDDATAFVEEYGGQTVPASDVDQQLVDGLN